MFDVPRVLIVGGGIGGMSTTIRFAQKGVVADLVDIDPEWRVLGAGLTITGPTLRAFRQLGVLDDIRLHGNISTKVKLFTGDGTLINESYVPVLEEGLPATGGILRPVLHQILSERTRASGAAIRLGVTVESFEQDAGSVRVHFTDGTSKNYEIVIGADGVMSKMRQLLFPDAPVPQFTGQGCWRVLADRPEGLEGAEIYFGKDIKAGITPCAPDKVYMFVLNAMPDNPWVHPEEGIERMRGLIADFGGNIAAIRDGMGPHSSFNYRPLESLLLPRPWSKGRVGLLGDAAHATTPHLASGAGIAVESALVLVDEMLSAPTVEEGWKRFEARRWERCKLVVETSVRIGQMELDHESEIEKVKAMDGANRALAMPI